jgi:hypothetical protein
MPPCTSTTDGDSFLGCVSIITFLAVVIGVGGLAG